jgi:hypothetical protein
MRAGASGIDPGQSSARAPKQIRYACNGLLQGFSLQAAVRYGGNAPPLAFWHAEEAAIRPRGAGKPLRLDTAVASPFQYLKYCRPSVTRRRSGAD